MAFNLEYQINPAYLDYRKAVRFQKISHFPTFPETNGYVQHFPLLEQANSNLSFVYFLSITGVIRTALHNMDREAREHYSVVIQAKDMAGQVGGLSGSTTVNITLTDVNDNPPRFPQSMYNFSI